MTPARHLLLICFRSAPPPVPTQPDNPATGFRPCLPLDPADQPEVRIFHTIDSAGIYGAEAVLLNLVAEQQQLGHQPAILSIGNPTSPEKALESEARRRGCECIPYRMKDGFNLEGAAGILQLAVEHGADAIHSHGYKTNILLAAIPRNRRPIPVVATLHGWTARRTLSKLGLYRFLDQRALRKLDEVVLVNEKMRQARAIAALDPDKVQFIPNGIPLQGTQAETPGGAPTDTLAVAIGDFRPPGGVLIGAVGRLSPEKNFSLLLRALGSLGRDYEHVRVVILGAGPEDALLRSLARSLGLADRVLFGGYAPNARQYFGLLDMLAIPSLTEGLPMTLLEAMAAGLPVIATAVGEISAVLGDAGVIVPPGNRAALGDAIKHVAGDLPSHRTNAAQGRQRVVEHYGAATMAKRYDAVYRRALQRKAHDA